MTNSGFELRQSPIEGQGVFATRSFDAGETVHWMDGARLSRVGTLFWVALGRLRWNDALQLDRSTYLAPDRISVTFNHSCEPTCGLRGERELFALRAVRPGEELTFDYSATVWPNAFTRTWRLDCRCGAARCRGSIGNLESLPREVVDRYLAANALQDSIRSHLLQRCHSSEG